MAPARLLLALSPKDLLTYGFVEGRGMVVIAAVFGLVWEFGMADSFMPSFPDFIDERVLNDEKALPQTAAAGSSGRWPKPSTRAPSTSLPAPWWRRSPSSPCSSWFAWCRCCGPPFACTASA